MPTSQLGFGHNSTRRIPGTNKGSGLAEAVKYIDSTYTAPRNLPNPEGLFLKPLPTNIGARDPAPKKRMN